MLSIIFQMRPNTTMQPTISAHWFPLTDDKLAPFAADRQNRYSQNSEIEGRRHADP